MPAPGAATVIDTADWSLVVPLKPPLNLTGSRLTAKMRAAFGGVPAAIIDSALGSILWTADPVTGLTDRLVIKVAKADRNGWLTPQMVSLFFDVHRFVDGSTADEWLGRSSVLVLPGSDSPLLDTGSAFRAALMPGQPGNAVLPALSVGPQGAKGEPGDGVLHVLSTAPGGAVAGQPLALTQVGALVLADSGVFARARVIGLAGADVQAGWQATAVRDHLYLADWSAATGASDLAIGRTYHLAPGGLLALLPDTVPGHCSVRVGWAADVRTLVIEPSQPFLN